MRVTYNTKPFVQRKPLSLSERMALNQIVTRLLHNRKILWKNIFKPSAYRLQFTNNGNYWYDNVLYKKRTLSNIYTEELHIHYKNTQTRQYI